MLTALAPSGAAAQAWTGAGVPVCTADGLQDDVRGVSDGAGGAFIGWSDQRAGTLGRDVYLQHLGGDGAPAPGWPVNGLAICQAVGEQLLFSMAPDGTGGVYLAWEDYRAGAVADIYGHHVLADGSLAAGWPADGLAICDFLGHQGDPELVPDGGSGVFCVWTDARTSAFSKRDVYAQHLLSDGSAAAGWIDDGMRVTNARADDSGPSLAPDGGGGLFVTWTHGLTGGGADISAQHLGTNGLPVATWPDTGLVLCNAPDDQNGAAVVPGPNGTAVAVWKDRRNYTALNTETGFYGARFGPDTTFAAGWPRQGLEFYSTLHGVSTPFVASDGAGSLLFGWGELVSGGADENLFVMHVDTTGLVFTSVPAPDGVLSICPSPAYQHPVAFVADGEGGMYVGFVDYRADPSFTNPDPYVQHVTGGPTIGLNWPTTGLALTLETTQETGTLPIAVPGGVIAVYARGTGAATDLYASAADAFGTVPALVSLASSEATPGRVRIEWAVSGTAASEWRIEKRGEADAWRAVATAFADGTGRVAYVDTEVAPGARYGYRLAPGAGGAPLGEAWVDVPLASPAFALRGVSPNPVTLGSRVRFALPAAGEATLALVDLQGRVARRWSLRGAEGEGEFALGDLGAVAPGIYWLRLAQREHTASVRVAIAR